MASPMLQPLEEARRSDSAMAAEDPQPAQNWEPPIPLAGEMPPAQEFPLQALSGTIRDAIEAIHIKTQAPLALGAQSVLAAANLAVQGLANVRLPTGADRPISNYFITVAVSGERKTTADAEALRGVRRHEQRLREQYEAEWPAFKNKDDAYQKQREQILRDKRQYPKWHDKQAALDALGNAPLPPLKPILTASEPTLEGLDCLFRYGQPSAGLFSSEGGEFFGGHAMSKEKKLRSIARLSSYWDGAPIDRVRAGEDAMVFYGRRLSVHLMAQPMVADVFLADKLTADQGLLSRFLVTAPESTIGTRFWRDTPESANAAIDAFDKRLYEILGLPLPLVEGKTNELAPPHLEFSPAGKKTWIEFYDHIEQQIGSGGELEPVRGFASKSPEIAARLAGVLSSCEDASRHEIPVELVDAGIDLIQHYLDEAMRLSGRISAPPAEARAAQLLSWLTNRWEPNFVSITDICQFGPKPLREKELARQGLSILEDHHYVRRARGRVRIGEFDRREAWLIRREWP